MSGFFDDATAESWQLALDGYARVLAAQSKERLPELDTEVWTHWPARIHARTPLHITRDELVTAMEWKMKRGAWRGWNVTKALKNSVEEVVRVSADALSQCPHPRVPLVKLGALTGVGPATASVVLAAAHPAHYAFLDEDVTQNVPGMGTAKYTVDYAVTYMERLRVKAAQLGWRPQDVAQALWVVGALGL